MSAAPKSVVVTGAFDDLRSRHVRFLEAAAKLGELTVWLWPDEAVRALTGKSPLFPEAERAFFLNAIRYVSRVVPVTGTINPEALPETGDFSQKLWVDGESPANASRRAFCQKHGLEYRVLGAETMAGFPVLAPAPTLAGRKKVVVTGSYDWFHSGHVRFFEEVSAFGDLYVVVGHDANIRLLKGEGHPLLPQEERRYLVGSIKHVKQALISSGDGWLDADPEIQQLKPDLYVVNEDGDKGGKREYCAQHGIQYRVLKRVPAPGLPSRSSTGLRGF